MGKRSNFDRVERDFYPTPEAALLPLLPHLNPRTRFIEPCAGDGRLVRHLEKHGHVCMDAFDIEPQDESVRRGSALDPDEITVGADCIITNPPWDRKVLHPMIETFRDIRDTWLLHDANWLFTRQAAPFLPYVRKIVAVGRVKWIEGSTMTGKDDAVWTLHCARPVNTLFFGR